MRLRRCVAITVVVIGLAVSTAIAAEPQNELDALRAQNAVYATAIKTRDKQIADLEERLKVAEKRIAKLINQLNAAGAVAKIGKAITDKDLTIESARNNDYTGMELLLDGYVVDVKAEKGEFLAIIAAGSEGTSGKPVMTRRSGRGRWGRITYQIQVQITGEAAAALRAGDRQRRVRGVVQKINVQRGQMYQRTRLSYVPQTSTGMVVLVALNDTTIE